MRPSDRRLTPSWVLEAARETAGGPLALDPCTEPGNPTRALAYLTIGGLEADWAIAARFGTRGVELPEEWAPIAWVNPPFSQMGPWVEKALGEGLPALVFSGVDYSTRWWRALDEGAVARCELRRRPRCVDPVSGRVLDVTRSAAVWLLSDSIALTKRYGRAFGGLGRVVAL